MATLDEDLRKAASAPDPAVETRAVQDFGGGFYAVVVTEAVRDVYRKMAADALRKERDANS